VLVAFGLASRDGDDYTTSPALRAFAEHSPDGLDGANALWAHAPAFLKTGTPFRDIDEKPAEREVVYSTIVAGIGRLFAGAAKDLAARIERAPDRVLDIGCGSGVWSLAIAERFAGARVTGLDLPDVLRAFESRAAELGLGDRIGTLPGDMHAVEIPAGAFDLVIIANVVRLEKPDRAGRLVARAAKALVPGGELVVVDALADGSAERARSLAVYALHLAIRLARGRVYTRAQIKEWLAHAGLSEFRDVSLSDPLGTVGAISSSSPDPHDQPEGPTRGPARTTRGALPGCRDRARGRAAR